MVVRSRTSRRRPRSSVDGSDGIGPVREKPKIAPHETHVPASELSGIFLFCYRPSAAGRSPTTSSYPTGLSAGPGAYRLSSSGGRLSCGWGTTPRRLRGADRHAGPLARERPDAHPRRLASGGEGQGVLAQPQPDEGGVQRWQPVQHRSTATPPHTPPHRTAHQHTSRPAGRPPGLGELDTALLASSVLRIELLAHPCADFVTLQANRVEVDGSHRSRGWLRRR
ncbi:MAG: hypothetical protein JWN52_895 [Actinomycetia bacterium]|nr:hypothetical protein [Actinomycetes bacterium]